MGRLALIVFMVIAVVFGVRSFAGKADVGTSDAGALGTAAMEGDLITLISKGQAVDIADYIPDEGVVIVEFTADW